MTTLAHKISTFMPQPVSDWLKPKWHASRELFTLFAKPRGTIRNNRELGCWVVTRPMGDKTLMAPARSIREFRRIVRFGENPDDLVFHWINMITDCDVLYDVGAANGHEGLSVQLLHGSHIVYIEMFTPSIETILKGTVLAAQHGAKISDFNVVAAVINQKATQKFYCIPTRCWRVLSTLLMILALTVAEAVRMNLFGHPSGVLLLLLIVYMKNIKFRNTCEDGY